MADGRQLCDVVGLPSPVMIFRLGLRCNNFLDITFSHALITLHSRINSPNIQQWFFPRAAAKGQEPDKHDNMFFPKNAVLKLRRLCLRYDCVPISHCKRYETTLKTCYVRNRKRTEKYCLL